MLKKIAALFVSVVVLFCIVFIWMDYDVKQGGEAYRHAHPASVTSVHRGDFQLYTEAKKLYKDLFVDIGNAKNYVYIHFFIIRNDEIGREFLNVLKRQARNGVDVKLSVDLLAGHELPGSVVKDLRDNGVSFTFSRKLHFPHPFYTLHHRNHRRIVVIDGKVSYIGGFNIGEEHIGKDKKLGHWQDYHVRITGNGAYEAEMQFLEDWKEDTGERIQVRRQTEETGKAAYSYIYSSGQGMEEHFAEKIRHAAKSITIATPYFVPSEALLTALRQARERDVAITIVVAGKTDASFLQPASYSKLRRMLDAGADIYEYKSGFFHGKMFIIDDTFASIGTVNFDERSMHINDESNCLIYDPDVVHMLQTALQADIHASKRLSSSFFHNLSFWKKQLQHTPERIQYYF